MLCMAGGTRKIKKERASKSLSYLRHIAEIMHRGDVETLMRRIDEWFYEVKKPQGKDPDKPAGQSMITEWLLLSSFHTSSCKYAEEAKSPHKSP